MAETLLEEVISWPSFRLNHHHAAADIFRQGTHCLLGLEVPVVDRRLGFVAGGSLPAVVNALFFDDLVSQSAIALDVRQHFPDFFLRKADHQALVPPPQAVVSFVLEDGQLRHLLPAKSVILRNLQQLLLQLIRPHIFSDRRIDEVAVTFSDLQFVLYLHLGCDDAPALAAEVLEKDNQHQRLPGGPSPGGQMRLHSVVILVVNLFGKSIFEELVDLFPILSVHPLLFEQQLILLQVEQPLGLFCAPEVHKGAVELHAIPELRALALLDEVDAVRVFGQRGNVNIHPLVLFGQIQFFDELALAIIVVVFVVELELLLADLHLLLEGGGQVALKLDVAEEASGRRVQDIELIGGDVLLEQFHALSYGVLQDWMHAWLPFIFCCAYRLSIRCIFNQRRRQLSAQGGEIVLCWERAVFMGVNSLIKLLINVGIRQINGGYEQEK